MADFAKEHNILKEKRKMLILSYSADYILLSSPLFIWYINHGLVVTDVHEVITFTPEKCFAKFAEKVTEYRCMGDVDPSKKVLAHSGKCLGSNLYGKFLEDPLKHNDVVYCSTAKAVHKIQKANFRKLNVITDDTYVIMSMFKTPIYV